MITLAFDTATPRPSLAVVDHEGGMWERNLGEVAGGGRRVLEAIHDILGDADTEVGDLDRIVVGVGPGGFTGIRIGIATALGLGHAAGIEVTGASSLEALALGLGAEHPDAVLLAPAIDARRKEVFGAIYRFDEGRLVGLLDPVAMAPLDFRHAVEQAAGDARTVIGGTGVLAYNDAFSGLGKMVSGPGEHHFPLARHLVARVDAGATVPARPVYCRLPDAEQNRRKRLEQEGA